MCDGKLTGSNLRENCEILLNALIQYAPFQLFFVKADGLDFAGGRMHENILHVVLGILDDDSFATTGDIDRQKCPSVTVRARPQVYGFFVSCKSYEHAGLRSLPAPEHAPRLLLGISYDHPGER